MYTLKIALAIVIRFRVGFKPETVGIQLKVLRLAACGNIFIKIEWIWQGPLLQMSLYSLTYYYLAIERKSIYLHVDCTYKFACKNTLNDIIRYNDFISNSKIDNVYTTVK